MSPVQRAMAAVFAEQLALRFGLIEPYVVRDDDFDPTLGESEYITIDVHPGIDLDEERQRLIEHFDVDPLYVFPTRPAD